jgi:hypothetical protein
MDNVTFEILEGKEYAFINHGEGAFTSMPKAEYERQQAEQSTPIVTDAD